MLNVIDGSCHLSLKALFMSLMHPSSIEIRVSFPTAEPAQITATRIEQVYPFFGSPPELHP